MSKFLEPRSYVRAFNAASMAEAIKLADEALRIDGVTVAVWKNYADIIPPEFHECVDKNIPRTFMAMTLRARSPF
jgi:hypothetical protein